MNYDMVGSPNYIFMVYDADESTFEAPVPVPAGSEAIEDVYESYYTALGIPYDDTEFSGRSDYEAFILAGIPSSGLFTGAEVPKTEEQEAIWGGKAGEQFDPCYHEACDTIDNVERVRARRQQRPHRVRDADVRVLDGVGQRCRRARRCRVRGSPCLRRRVLRARLLGGMRASLTARPSSDDQRRGRSGRTAPVHF